MTCPARHLAAILLALPIAAPHAASAQAAPAPQPAAVPVAHGVVREQPLQDALRHLRDAGLGLVYSTALVPPELKVSVEPGEGSPEQVARRILAPLGLALQSVRPGQYVVVRAPATRTGNVAPVGAASDLEEVPVYASRYRLDPAGGGLAVDMSRGQIDELPGINQDLMRALRYLPGTATNGVSARANVRGGRDNELAVYFDGVPLFEPFHFKDYQGVLGVLDPGAIARLEFFSGVTPARYGDRLSGVLDIEPRGAESGDHHELGLSLLYAHALSVGEGHWRGHAAGWLVSLRQSTAEYVLKAAERRSVDPEFLDALGRMQLEFGDRSRLTAGFMLLADSLRADIESGGERTRTTYRDGTGWLALRHELDSGTHVLATASITSRQTDRSGSIDRPGSVTGSVADERDLGARTLRIEAGRNDERNSDVESGVSPALAGWTTGVELRRYNAEYDYAGAARFDPLLSAAFGRPGSFARNVLLDVDGESWAGYADLQLAPWRHWRFVFGLRLDAQRYDGVTRFADEQWSPRFAAELALDSGTTLRASAGRVSQAERPDELQVADGDPLFHAAQRATHYVLGLERRLGPGSSLRVEAYRKNLAHPAPGFENQLDPLAVLPELEVDRVRVAPLSAEIHGTEITWRWQLPPAWSGWVGYTGSEATDRFVTGSAPRSWSQAHALTSGVAWAQGPWQLSAGVNAHTGWRRSDVSTVADASAPGRLAVRLGARNAAHWDPYFSLDLRASWRHPLASGVLRVDVEVSNATNHSNACCSSIAVSDVGGTQGFERESSNWLPRYGLVGVAWELP